MFIVAFPSLKLPSVTLPRTKSPEVVTLELLFTQYKALELLLFLFSSACMPVIAAKLLESVVVPTIISALFEPITKYPFSNVRLTSENLAEILLLKSLKVCFESMLIVAFSPFLYIVKVPSEIFSRCLLPFCRQQSLHPNRVPGIYQLANRWFLPED